jgi:hypothetical protein
VPQPQSTCASKVSTFCAPSRRYYDHSPDFYVKSDRLLDVKSPRFGVDFEVDALPLLFFEHRSAIEKQQKSTA